MNDDEKAAYRKRYGREPSMREQLMGEIDRTGAPQFGSDANFRPVMAPPKGPSTIFDEALAEAEEEAKRERVRKMSPSERRVQMILEARNEQLKKQADAESHVERLKQLEKPIRLLNELREQIRWDASWTVEQAAAIDNALLQLTTPGADVKVGMNLFEKAVGIEKAKKSEQRAAVVAKMKSLGAEEAQLDAAIAALSVEISGETPTQADVDAAYQRWLKTDALDTEASLKAHATYERLKKAADAAAEGGEQADAPSGI
jgi:hypothetical protein